MAKRTMKPSVIGESNYRMAKIDAVIRNTKLVKPVYSESSGRVVWGLTTDKRKEKKR